MEIKDLVGKTCLISKIYENNPIEVSIICLSENNDKFNVQFSSGERTWLNINEYKVISSLSKITLSETIFRNNKSQLLFD